MQIVPVLDIMGGVVVRAIGGRRSEYRPLVSKLTTSTDPVTVATAIRDGYQMSEIYVADLDAIAGAAPSYQLFDKLRANGFRICVDAGARNVNDVERIAEHVDGVVIGSETGAALFLSEPPALAGGVSNRKLPPLTREARYTARLIFSLDLRNGIPLGDWNTSNPIVIAERAIAAGIDRIILLDLARVGTHSGIGTVELARNLIRRFASVQILVGGGVRSMEDVKRLESIGVRGVLVASALHDGELFS
jgi:phosphoribosylformimino-5-aminoimidazole carboxamide ribotide isomerase